MEEERHLNMKKVVITVAVFIFAFFIIIASALITNNSSKKIAEKKKLAASDSVQISQDTNENQEASESTQTTNSESQVTNVTTVEISKSAKLPVYNENCVELVKGLYSSDEKQVFLTFDDGPSSNVTPQILDILDKYNVPATFFVLGSRVELYPDLLKREFNSGHYIANHGYSHVYSTIYSSVQTVIDEYNTTETAIQNALGLSDYHSNLFRFPGGSSGGVYDSLKSQAKSYLNNTMGVATTNWNCLTGDAEGGKRTKDQLLSRLYETADEASHNTLVILMHDAGDKQTTADALPEIIEHYQSLGYTFKNYYDIFQ
jgi:peptidoglycan/xylan/chitin deacetylase (PgdA/CDA1 family)